MIGDQLGFSLESYRPDPRDIQTTREECAARLQFGTRRTDPITSHEAEAKVRPHASTGRRAVLSALALYGPLTDFELAERTGWQQTSIGKRRGECVALGWVEAFTAPDGTKCKRPSPSGSPAIVWAITAKGREAHDAMRNESR